MGRKLMALGVCAPAAPPSPSAAPDSHDDSDTDDVVARTRKWLGVSPGIAGSVALAVVGALTAGVLYVRSQWAKKTSRYGRDSQDHAPMESSYEHHGRVPRTALTSECTPTRTPFEAVLNPLAVVDNALFTDDNQASSRRLTTDARVGRGL